MNGPMEKIEHHAPHGVLSGIRVVIGVPVPSDDETDPDIDQDGDPEELDF